MIVDKFKKELKKEIQSFKSFGKDKCIRDVMSNLFYGVKDYKKLVCLI